LRWQGTCIHDVQVPKWVQKRKQVHPDEEPRTDDYEQPRRAVKVVVNMKFSLIAVGTHWYVSFLSTIPFGYGCHDTYSPSGNVEYTTLPSQPGAALKPQVLETPQSYNIKDRGPVCAMEWSSDGYVLAVGWEKGWAVWSVAGRCLAWSFRSENRTDEIKYDKRSSRASAVLLNSDCQIQRYVYERHPGPCGPLVLALKSSFSNSQQFWAPGNFELFVLSRTDGRSE
jgi:hypothetical protein